MQNAELCLGDYQGYHRSKVYCSKISRHCHSWHQTWKSQNNFSYIGNLPQLNRSMLKLVKITENTWRLRMSCIFIATKAIPGKHKNLQDEICMHGQKQFQGLFLWSIYSSWHVISFFNVLNLINLQSTYLLEWNRFVLPRFLPSRMCMGPGLHCISSSIMCFAAQNSQFQLTWLYLGEELVTVCLLSNLFVYWRNTCRAMVACLSKRSQCRSKRKLSAQLRYKISLCSNSNSNTTRI